MPSTLELKGKVQTIHGLVSPSDLGRILPHEHLLIDFSCAFTPAPATEAHKAQGKKKTKTNEKTITITRYY